MFIETLRIYKHSLRHCKLDLFKIVFQKQTTPSNSPWSAPWRHCETTSQLIRYFSCVKQQCLPALLLCIWCPIMLPATLFLYLYRWNPSSEHPPHWGPACAPEPCTAWTAQSPAVAAANQRARWGGSRSAGYWSGGVWGGASEKHSQSENSRLDTEPAKRRRPIWSSPASHLRNTAFTHSYSIVRSRSWLYQGLEARRIPIYYIKRLGGHLMMGRIPSDLNFNNINNYHEHQNS